MTKTCANCFKLVCNSLLAFNRDVMAELSAVIFGR